MFSYSLETMHHSLCVVIYTIALVMFFSTVTSGAGPVDLTSLVEQLFLLLLAVLQIMQQFSRS